MSADLWFLVCFWSVMCVALGYIIGSSLSFDMMWRKRIREAADKVASERPDLVAKHRQHMESRE